MSLYSFLVLSTTNRWLTYSRSTKGLQLDTGKTVISILDSVRLFYRKNWLTWDFFRVAMDRTPSLDLNYSGTIVLVGLRRPRVSMSFGEPLVPLGQKFKPLKT